MICYSIGIPVGMDAFALRKLQVTSRIASEDGSVSAGKSDNVR